MIQVLTTLVALAMTTSIIILQPVAAVSTTVPVLVSAFDNPRCHGTPAYQYFAGSGTGCNPFSGPGDQVKVTEISTGKVEEQNLGWLAYSCLQPTFTAFGKITQNTCPKRVNKAIDGFCFAYYENGNFLFAERAICYPCRPFPTMTKNHCNNVIQKCEHLTLIQFEGPPEVFDVPMKWTGKGCRSSDGKPLGDGGCQCDQYCGYTCKDACNNDGQCYWNDAQNACYNSQSNLPGHPIGVCPPVSEYEGPPPKPSAKEYGFKAFGKP